MTTGARLRHVPGLDGLRGVAVAGVVAFHLGRLDGGFLGVDAFFVLSGFLITSLLVAEHAATGRIALGAFWGRRVRRLLPALVVLLVAVAVYAWVVAAPLELERLRADGLATIAYVANWRDIWTGASYWDQFNAPSPLRHTWSLAIEEQFYLVWPLVVAVVLAWWRRSLTALLALTGALVAASTAAMVLLYRPGTDPSRVYYGTDTRAAAVLVGAALAIGLARHGPARTVAGRLAIEGAALVAVAGSIAAWALVDGTSAGLYRGGLLLGAVGVAAVIAAVVHPTPGPVARLFSWRPLCLLGLISYGLYLWHWPVIVWMTPARTHLDGWALDGARVAVALAAAIASYVLVERPIRTGATIRRLTPVVVPLAIGACAVAVLAATTGAVLSPSPAAGAASASTAPGPEGSPTGPHLPRVLVVGDSGAYYLGQGMAAVAGAGPGAGVVVDPFGTVGCGIARASGGARADDGTFLPDPPGCDQWPARWAAEVARFRPDVAVVVLAWPGSGDREVAGRWRHPCDPIFDSWYTGQAVAAVAALQPGVPTVYLATAPYYTGPNVISNGRGRVDCLNADYRAAAAAVPGTHLLDLAGRICPGGSCRSTEDGVTLRPDGLHVEGRGAEVVGRWALGELTSPTGP